MRENMSDAIELINIIEFAEMLRRSPSWIRLELKERRLGKNVDTPIPAPISTRPKQRLFWVKEECIRYIERLNATANGTPSQTQSLSPEVLMRAAQLGLTDDCKRPRR